MKYRQWKKNYKKKYGANPPFELDKRKQRRYARKMARQINITVEEYLATFPKIKLTRREYLQTLPLYHAALYLAETTQKVHSSQEWYLYLNEKVDQNGEVLSGEYDVSETNQKET